MSSYTSWPAVDKEALTAKAAARYEKFHTAICAYLDGAKIATVCAQHGLHRRTLWRVIKRCRTEHSDGNFWGFRALVPYTHVNPYRSDLARRSGKNAAGLFAALLRKFPNIQTRIYELYLKGNAQRELHEPRIEARSVHRRFLQLLREGGIREHEYPFNTRACGYRALCRFLQRIKAENAAAAAAARGQKDAGRRLALTTSPAPNVAPKLPYERVVFDGHRLDAIATIMVHDPMGNAVPVVSERPWLLVVFDEASRAVLGYHLTLGNEYNGDDVLRSMQKALVPWKPLALSIPDLVYTKGSGLPSGLIPELAYATWVELAFDNASAHLAKEVRERIVDVVGCYLNAGPIAMPERRALIERFFGTLERNGFQRLPSTTGSHSQDPRRKNAEAAAIRFEISLEEIEQLLDVIICDYNNTPHRSLNNKTPIEYLRHFIATGGLVRCIPQNRRDHLGLLMRRAERRVRGNPKSGRRPYIEFEGVTYHNPVLSRSVKLIGQRLSLHINVDDLRTVKAFLPNGTELGILTAHGLWGLRPHDFRTRAAILKLRRSGSIRYATGEDPIETYRRHLEKRAVHHKPARTKLVRLRRAEPQILPPQTVLSKPSQVRLPDAKRKTLLF